MPALINLVRRARYQGAADRPARSLSIADVAGESRSVDNAPPDRSPDGSDGRGPGALLVIDSRDLTRDCLLAALHSAGIELVIAVANIEQALHHAEGGAWFKAVFINLAADDFTPESLLEITAPLHALVPRTPLLLMSERIDPARAAAALKQGIHALLSRDLALELTVAAIRLVELGWTLVPSEFMPIAWTEDSIAERYASDANWRLTGRQTEVLNHLRSGMPNKQIARLLNISERTVKAHVKELMRRFRVTNRTQIVASFSRPINPAATAAAEDP